MPVLLICVTGSASQDEAQLCRRAFEELSAQRWTYRPVFVDQVDELPVTSPDQLPSLRIVGAYMALPEPGETADEDPIRRDVTAFVEAWSSLAARTRIEFSVEYRDEQIGALRGTAQDPRVIADFLGSGGARPPP